MVTTGIFFEFGDGSKHACKDKNKKIYWSICIYIYIYNILSIEKKYACIAPSPESKNIYLATRISSFSWYPLENYSLNLGMAIQEIYI